MQADELIEALWALGPEMLKRRVIVVAIGEDDKGLTEIARYVVGVELRGDNEIVVEVD